MRKMFAGLFVVSLSILAACTKDRTFDPPPPTPPAGGADNIVRGTITINEFMAKGSTFFNELDPVPGDNDWLELYNTTGDTIYFEEGAWFLTDVLTDTTMFEVPDTLILPNGFLSFQCDEMDTTITQIHTNFKLSSAGEQVVLFHKKENTWLNVDDYSFGAQTPGVSMARFPDGSANWIFSNNPTPDNNNQE